MNKNSKIKKKTDSKLKELLLSTENGWLSLSKGEEKELNRFCEEYRVFLSKVKTERDASKEAIELARKKGFIDIKSVLDTKGKISPGDKVYVNIADKTVILFHLGSKDIVEGMRIIGGHTDSPRLDLKPRPIYEDGGLSLLDTHYYGGVKKYQWVTIPLALHGVVTKKNGEVIHICIGEDEKDPVFTITDILPHLGKDQGEKKLTEAITGEGLNVLFGSIPVNLPDVKEKVKLNTLKILNSNYDIDEKDLTSAELELVPAGPARDLGIDRSMILGYGQDDRVSAYTAIRALYDLKQTPQTTAMCILTDKEEIGSVGATGMYSFLFENVVAEIINLTTDNYSDLLLRRCLKNSKMLSADVNALHDPNYPEVSSPNNNMAKMNHGLVLTKYVGSRGKSGSNDAHAEYLAELRRIFDDAGVLWQTGEIGKVDQGGGGTIAFMLARYEMDVVDCGVGLLSMHAPWEVVGKLDVYMAHKGYSSFFKT